MMNWEPGQTDAKIYSLNFKAEERKHANIHPVAGGATNMQEL